MSGSTDSARAHLLEDILRIIEDAERSSSVVRAGCHAGRLLAAQPNAGLSLGRIIDEIVAAAGASKVPVEISREQ